MACEMCSGTDAKAVPAEVVDGMARRPHPEHAMAELDGAGTLWIETPLGDGHGGRYSILLPMAFCPWCGARLQDAAEWETASEGEA